MVVALTLHRENPGSSSCGVTLQKSVGINQLGFIWYGCTCMRVYIDRGVVTNEPWGSLLVLMPIHFFSFPPNVQPHSTYYRSYIRPQLERSDHYLYNILLLNKVGSAQCLLEQWGANRGANMPENILQGICVHVYMCTCVHVYCVHVYMCVCVCVYMYKHIYTYIYTYIYIYVCSFLIYIFIYVYFLHFSYMFL